MNSYKAIVIGGSAGSFQPVTKILSSLREKFDMPIFVCLHRLKHIRSGYVEALSIKTKCSIVEPFDKDKIKTGTVYLAPSNYHMLIEIDNTISLSTEKPVNHSRPAIDLLFETASYAYNDKLIGIILSGANSDGAAGLRVIQERGGVAIVQDPNDAQIKTMPKEALKETNTENIFSLNQIIDYIKQKI